MVVVVATVVLYDHYVLGVVACDFVWIMVIGGCRCG